MRKGLARQTRAPGDELKKVAFWMPKSLIEALDELAFKKGVTRSRLIVELLESKIKEIGGES